MKKYRFFLAGCRVKNKVTLINSRTGAFTLTGRVISIDKYANEVWLQPIERFDGRPVTEKLVCYPATTPIYIKKTRPFKSSKYVRVKVPGGRPLTKDPYDFPRY